MSRKPWVNRLCGYLGSALCSPLIWNHQHNIGHHQYPNIKGLDPDLYHFQELTAFRYHPQEAYLPMFRYWRLTYSVLQFFAPLGMSFNMPFMAMIESNLFNAVSLVHVGFGRRLLHVMGRLLVWILGVVPPGMLWVLRYPPMQPASKAFAFTALPWLILGFIFHYFTQISHINEECFNGPRGACKSSSDQSKEPEQDSSPVDWAVHQIHSTWDYQTTSHLMNFISVSLNNQIVHHLFPSIHPCHYPDLSPIVCEIARKHGYDIYTRSNESWWVVNQRYLSWLAKVNDL